jgi:hypothetical protein
MILWKPLPNGINSHGSGEHCLKTVTATILRCRMRRKVNKKRNYKRKLAPLRKYVEQYQLASRTRRCGSGPALAPGSARRVAR